MGNAVSEIISGTALKKFSAVATAAADYVGWCVMPG